MTEQNNSTPVQALGFIVFGGVMLSFTSIFVNLANVGPSVSAFYRMFFGGIMLLTISLIRRDRLWYGVKSLIMPSLGALFFSLDLFFWHRSINFVGPGLATILGNMQVFFVAVFAVWFLHEKLDWKLMLAIPIAVLGLFLIIRTSWGQQGGQVKTGVLYGVITAFSYALYILILRKSRSADRLNRYSLFVNMAWISLISAFLLAITVWIEPETSFTIPDVQSWGALLGLGIMGQVLGWVLISQGLPDVDASVGGLALLLQPALAFIWDILIFDRPTTGLEYLGAAIVLAAIYLGAIGNK